MLESVQHRFLRLLAFRSGSPMRYDEHDYTPFARRHNVPTLKTVRDVHDACFAYKIANNDLPCPELISQFVHRNVDYNIRLPRLLKERSYPQNFAHHSVVPRLIRLWNSLPSEAQNAESIGLFKRNVKSLLYTF